MYKNIALLALLLPFSGYAITKQERAQKRARMTQIVQEVQDLNKQVEYLNEVIKHNFWVVFLAGDAIRQDFNDARKKTIELNQEYTKLEQEIA